MMNNINLQIDAAARQVSQNGKAVYLTQTEFDLLLYLLDNAGRITTRSELLAQVWGITAPIHTRTVDMHIAKLRRLCYKKKRPPKANQNRWFLVRMFLSRNPTLLPIPRP